MDNQSGPKTMRDGTSLALRLEDRLSRLQAERRRIEQSGTTGERAALQATIGDVQRLLRRVVRSTQAERDLVPETRE